MIEKEAFYKLTYGLFVLTTKDENGKDNGGFAVAKFTESVTSLLTSLLKRKLDARAITTTASSVTRKTITVNQLEYYVTT